MKKKITLYWILSIVITLAAVVLQRMTGPTNPQRVSFTLDGAEYRTKLPRSMTITETGSLLKFTIKGLPEDIVPGVFARQYRSKGKWTTYAPQREGPIFTVQLPPEPPAGKIEYYLFFTKAESDMVVTQEELVVARFKNDVPALLLIPHILLMFASMLFSNLSGLLAFFRHERYITYAKIALACLFLGGMVLGCLVQKAAFGSYWTGFPFGNDLTDNKTLFALIFWIIAVVANWRSQKHSSWIGFAALFMLLVYCIPHSTMGSEYDYQTGKVESETIETFTP